MGKGSTKTAAVEVDDVFVMAQGEDDALVEGIGALRVEQTKLPEEIEAMSRPLDQRRRVEGSGKRFESFRLGNAFSQEQFSTKRRRNA